MYNVPDSHRAVDGNANSNYMSGSCTHSGYVGEKYWAVDLGQSYWIMSLRITNRGDCCGNVKPVSEVQHISRQANAYYYTFTQSLPSVGHTIHNIGILRVGYAIKLPMMTIDILGIHMNCQHKISQKPYLHITIQNVVYIHIFPEQKP